jgi:SAM-dependent methyltransferase
VRLRNRSVHVWSGSYLTYRYLWPNLEAAVMRAKGKLPSDSRVVLDVGCGNRPYADLFADCEYIGLNYSAQDACPDVIADAMKLPIATGTIDLVFCTQVLEHLAKPWRFLEECHRVLRSGGWIVLSAPLYWPLHEEPHDYFRYTRYGLESLMTSAGFAQCEIRNDGGDQARFWLSAIHSSPRWLRRAVQLPFNVMGVILDRVFASATFPANYTLLARSNSSVKDADAASENCQFRNSSER